MTLRTDDPTAPDGYPAPATPPVPPGAPPVARTAAASRRTNHRMLILGVLVVLIGGVVAFSAGRMLTTKSLMLAVARPVPLGATITDADLTTAHVTSDPHLSPIPASQRSQIVGLVAQVALSPGQLLTRSQVGTATGFSPGQMIVALALKDGQFPARGLSPGQTVLVVETPATTTGSTTADVGTLGRTVTATVAEMGSTNPSTQITVIDLRVDADDGPTVARLASTGAVAVILLPAGR
jgi:hypothetical protein